jgi:hypothetical protein
LNTWENLRATNGENKVFEYIDLSNVVMRMVVGVDNEFLPYFSSALQEQRAEMRIPEQLRAVIGMGTLL